LALIGARSSRSGGAEPLAQPAIVTDECAEQRGSNAIEPERRIAHELQMKLGRRTIVPSLRD
jgi:hypothetical protein